MQFSRLLPLLALAFALTAAEKSPLVLDGSNRPSVITAVDVIRLPSTGPFFTGIYPTATADRDITLPDATTTLAGLSVAQTFTAAQTVQAVAGVTSLQAATQDAVALVGRAGGSSSFVATLTPPTLAGNATITLPAATSALATLALAETFTNKTLTSPVISGGTIDNASVGATTRSTGAFTTLVANGATTVTNASGITSLQAATQDAVRILGRAGGSSSFVSTLTPPTLAGNATITLPAATSALATLALTETFTNKTLTSPAISGGTINNASLGATTRNTAAVTTLAANGAVTMTAGTASTTTTTGTAVITGGVGISGAMNVGSGVTLSGRLVSGATSAQASYHDNATGTYSTWAHNATAVGDIGVGNQIISGGLTTEFGLTSRAGNLLLGANTAITVTISTSAVTLASGRNLIMSGAGTLTTGTGAIALNGPTTIASGSNLALTSGNITLAAAGNGLLIKEGTNATLGTATLVAGSVVVSTTKVTAASRIQLTGNSDGGTPGWLRVSTRTAGTSFTVTSSSGTDTGTVGWVIVEPAP